MMSLHWALCQLNTIGYAHTLFQIHTAPNVNQLEHAFHSIFTDTIDFYGVMDCAQGIAFHFRNIPFLHDLKLDLRSQILPNQWLYLMS